MSSSPSWLLFRLILTHHLGLLKFSHWAFYVNLTVCLKGYIFQVAVQIIRLGNYLVSLPLSILSCLLCKRANALSEVFVLFVKPLHRLHWDMFLKHSPLLTNILYDHLPDCLGPCKQLQDYFQTLISCDLNAFNLRLNIQTQHHGMGVFTFHHYLKECISFCPAVLNLLGYRALGMLMKIVEFSPRNMQ